MPKDDKYCGYQGSSLDWLKNQEFEVWDEIEVIKKDSTVKGVILPRSELVNPNFISLKLSTGYNIGFNIEGIEKARKIGHKKGKYKIPKVAYTPNPEKPFIPILGCGGTIASRLDYQTGGTIPTLTPEELFSSFPEIANLARIETHQLFDIFSENITLKHYTTILKEIETILKTKKPKGIILTHGTDTMSFTAAAISFSITNPPVPIVITGSQRSSDRPSSDAFSNLYNSVLYASSSNALKEIVVIMHDESSDTSFAIHNATRVRKMHSSRRNTFRSIGSSPLGRIIDKKIQYFYNQEHYSPNSSPSKLKLKIQKKFDERVGLIYHYPGIKPDLLQYYIDTGYKGIVLVGTGLGHVSSNLIPIIKRAVDNEIVVVMTTQCLHGFTGLFVYESGRLILNSGVIPLANILPEVAYIKLAFLLGNYQKIEKVKELMKKNLKGEILARERFKEFP
ncbi:MAG: Glu-tRNA(Gln) amidotransferase subunit GatD [Candidatus Hodarchaeota archaeon]